MIDYHRTSKTDHVFAPDLPGEHNWRKVERFRQHSPILLGHESLDKGTYGMFKHQINLGAEQTINENEPERRPEKSDVFIKGSRQILEEVTQMTNFWGKSWVE